MCFNPLVSQVNNPRTDAEIKETKAAETLSLALIAGDFIAREAEWVRRRVETIRFVDGTRARVGMSIDFAIPDLSPFLVEEGATIAVPLAMPRKVLLRNFDVCDEQGAALPVLTRDENSAISAELLARLSEGCVKNAGHGSLLPDVADRLRDIVGAPRQHEKQVDEKERPIRAGAALITF
jgi:hypothetical protein